MMDSIFKAIAAVFSWLGKRSDARNRTDVVRAERQKNEEAWKADVRDDIAKRRTDDVRKHIAPLIAFLAILLVSCSTVAPEVVVPSEAGWDGGEQTSGLLGWSSDGWAILTPNALDRYQALARKYGDRFVPPLDPFSGIRLLDFEEREDLHLLDPEHLEKFVQMSRWARDEAVD